MKRRTWFILLLIAIWALVIIIAAPSRRTVHSTEAALPAAALAQIDAQARSLCARHRASAGAVITLPDGVLECADQRRSRQARSVITVPAHQLAEARP